MWHSFNPSASEGADVLLASGLDITSIPEKGLPSFLTEAIETRKHALILYLIAHGASVSAVDGLGRHPLSLAAERPSAGSGSSSSSSSSSADAATARILLAHGAVLPVSEVARLASVPTLIPYSELCDPSKTDISFISNAAAAGREDVVRSLLARGASPMGEVGDIRTPLVLACENGHINVAELLLASGAQLNAHDARGYSPLAAAAERGRLEAIDFCLKRGASVHIGLSDDSQWTPLMLASREGHVACVKRLIAAGGDPSAFDADGYTALYHAAERGQVGVLALLLQLQPVDDDDLTIALVRASASENPEAVKLLLKAGADAARGVSDGTTPLISAAREGRVENVDILVEAGAPLDGGYGGGAAGSSPLMEACGYGELAVAKRLLERGADSETRDDSGRSALMYASIAGKGDLVSLLISFDCDVNAADAVGNTALRMACVAGDEGITRSLLAAGANVFAVASGDGRGCFQIACEAGHDGVAAALADNGALGSADAPTISALLAPARARGLARTVAVLEAARAKKIAETPKAKARAGGGGPPASVASPPAAP
jgi:ankyrin repeat protein